jgi:hypothetical protein
MNMEQFLAAALGRDVLAWDENEKVAASSGMLRTVGDGSCLWGGYEFLH